MGQKAKPGDPDWRIINAHKTNFSNLLDAAKNNRIALMDCILKSTGEHVAVITLTNTEEDGGTIMVPMAMFFNDNPYELLISPLEYEESLKR